MDAPPEQAPDRAFDEYLVALSQAGSADALDGLVRRWTPRLLRYAARMLGGSGATEAARDVVQETWLGVVRGLRSLRDPAQFPAWIYGIATRKCADAIRTRVRRRQVDLAAGRNAGERAPADEAGAERRLDLDSAIRALPDEQRAVIHLFYREDLTVEEVATALAIPPGTVKSRLHYAREALKRHLEERT